MFSKTKESIAAVALLGTLFGTAAAQPLAEPLPAHSTSELEETALPDGLTAEDVNKIQQDQYRRWMAVKPYAETFAFIMDMTEQNGAQPVGFDKMMEGALKGALNALDPHSDYISAEEYKEMQTAFAGQFGGLGIEITQEGKLIKIVSPIDGTPAAKAGIQPGDLIISIGETSTFDMKLPDALKLMRGTPGESVTLTLRRMDTPEPITVSLVREIIKMDPIKLATIGDDIGYIRISSFESKTLASDIADAMAVLGDRNMVIDLRNDPGGLLSQAIKVSDLFLDNKDVIVTVKSRGKPDEIHRARPGAALTPGKEVIVLVNGGSASASEIVAGALQDNKRAKILGTQTFGKGSVQTIFPLGQYMAGRNDAVKITTALYYTPLDRSIQGKGITPDIAFNDTAGGNAQDDFVRSEASLQGALANPDSTSAEKGNKTTETCTPNRDAPVPENLEKALVDKDGKPDYQLICAVEYLRGKPALTKTAPVNVLQAKAQTP